MAKSLSVFLLLGLASLTCQATEIVELPSADGGTVTLEITLPPDFDPAVRYRRGHSASALRNEPIQPQF